MHVSRRAEARGDSALDPGVGERGVLAGKVQPSLGRDDVLEQRFLARLKESKRASGDLFQRPLDDVSQLLAHQRNAP